MKNQLTASTRLLYEECARQELDVSIINSNLLELKINNRLIYLKGSRTSLQSSVGYSIADNKDLTKVILNRHKIPNAKHIVVKKIKQLNFPLVMKPIDGNQGKGVIVGIKSYSKARTFFIQSQMQEKKSMIFEETLVGSEFRILCIDHKFVAATLRKPAFVVGDGNKTIEELIYEKNHPKIVINYLLAYDLNAQNLSYTSIPDKGEEVQLRKISNLSSGGEPENVTDQVCEYNKKLFERISLICDLNVAGLDIMCKTLSKPIDEQHEAGVIEVNASPGLRMHHCPLKGKPIDVAKKIIEMIVKHTRFSPTIL